MTFQILSESEYPAIRAAIDVSLTKSNLEDNVIGLSIYRDAAIQDIYQAYLAAGNGDDPATETNAGKIAHIRRAAIFFCAARLCAAVVRITSLNVSTRDLSYSRQTFDPEKRADELRNLANDELAEILDPSATITARPIMFTLATGNRGR